MRSFTKNISGKRGEAEFLVYAVIGIITIFLLTFILHSFYISMKEKLEVQNCKNSISAHSILVSLTNREVFTDIKCPIRYISVDVNDNIKSKRQIAEDMHRCWYEWNRGDGQYFKGDGVFCHICSIYTFKPSNTHLDGFMQYLMTENIMTKYPGDPQKTTYMDYMQNYQAPNSAGMLKKLGSEALTNMTREYSINTSQQYATIFVYASGKDGIQKFLEGGTRTTVGTAGLGLGLIGGLSGGLAAASAVGLVNAWNPVGWTILAGTATVLAAGALYMAFDVEDPKWVSMVVFKPYNAEVLTNLNCERLDVSQQSHSSTK